MLDQLYRSMPEHGSTELASVGSSSEYSTTCSLPARCANTPTFSSGYALATTLAPHCMSLEEQYPANTGSATLTRMLSTLQQSSASTPCFSMSSKMPFFFRATYTPPLPSGAIASFPSLSMMTLPSGVNAGSVPWLKKTTWPLSSPKYRCFSKNSTVSACVAGLVMTYQRIRQVPPARTCRRAIRSACSWNRLFPEGRPTL
mmetsp:Transcript_10451/g.28581  ORF Transcript_10451/g.28581 Transcript_10451/m.28581 type:complete len:201 (+) Transcript_10451:3180-3782(+)